LWTLVGDGTSVLGAIMFITKMAASYVPSFWSRTLVVFTVSKRHVEQ
jgi:hypothetical protein